jgi:hypothetical protein
MPAENVPTELPPSAESPSMGWLAMASGSSQLDGAIAQARSDLFSAPKDDQAAASGSAPSEAVATPTARADSGPARTARPVRAAGGLGVVVVNSTTVKAAEPPPGADPAPASEPAPSRAPARSTQARLPRIELRTAQSVSPQQVLAALQSRGMMEEWQLAQELGMAPDALGKLLTTLEEDGQVRLMGMGDDQRMVVRID